MDIREVLNRPEYDFIKTNPHLGGSMIFATFGGMCGYEFNQFFDEKDIDCENDMRVQEMFLEKINMLIDSGIITLEDK